MKTYIISVITICATSVFAGTPGDGYKTIECSLPDTQNKVLEMIVLDQAPSSIYSYSLTMRSELTEEQIQAKTTVLYGSQKLADGKIKFKLAENHTQSISVIADLQANSVNIETFDSDDGAIYLKMLKCGLPLR